MCSSDSTDMPARKRKRCRGRVCFSNTDGALSRVKAAIEGTEYAEAKDNLVSILEGSRRVGTDTMEPSVVVEKFTAGDRAINYDVVGSDIVEKWGEALRACSETSARRVLEGRGVSDVLENVSRGVNVAKTVAQMCFIRYLYEDFSNGLNLDQSSAFKDALLIEIVVQRAIVDAKLSPIDLVELLRLLTVFSTGD